MTADQRNQGLDTQSTYSSFHSKLLLATNYLQATWTRNESFETCTCLIHKNVPQSHCSMGTKRKWKPTMYFHFKALIWWSDYFPGHDLEMSVTCKERRKINKFLCQFCLSDKYSPFSSFVWNKYAVCNWLSPSSSHEKTEMKLSYFGDFFFSFFCHLSLREPFRFILCLPGVWLTDTSVECVWFFLHEEHEGSKQFNGCLENLNICTPRKMKPIWYGNDVNEVLIHKWLCHVAVAYDKHLTT